MLGNLLRTTRTTSSLVVVRWKGSDTEKKLTVYDPYVTKPQKNKETYLEVIKMFEGHDIRRRGHVEFIYASLARMKEFGVEKDLEVYKALVDVLPKGKFIPTNIFQAEFMHYPKQQQCAVDLLEQMEDNSEQHLFDVIHYLKRKTLISTRFINMLTIILAKINKCNTYILYFNQH